MLVLFCFPDLQKKYFSATNSAMSPDSVSTKKPAWENLNTILSI